MVSGMLGGQFTSNPSSYTSKEQAYKNTSKCAKDRFKRMLFTALSVLTTQRFIMWKKLNKLCAHPTMEFY